MGDLDKFVNRREEPSPYEKIVVNPIEKDRKSKEEYTSLKSSTRFQIFSTLVSYFKKMLSSLSSRGKGQSLLSGQQDLLDNILSYRKMLLILAKKDESHNPEFTQKLTELWHKLIEECNSLSYSTPASSEILTKLNFFLTEVRSYPLGADHPLGYYFTEYAGREWIPFPFMELLQGLHENFQADPPASVLNHWITMLSDILGLSGNKSDRAQET